MRKIILLMILILFCNCKTREVIIEPEQAPTTSYFPSNTNWETVSPQLYQFKQDKINELYAFLESKNTKSFIVLINGRIVLEKYFGNHTEQSNWYWASAGKTLTSATVGIAQGHNLLQNNQKVSQYLGTNWTSAPIAKENNILIQHLLTMTSGLDDSLGDNVSPNQLQYIADAGTRWAYHNVYVKLQEVVAQASGVSFETYFNQNLKNKIGMDGAWLNTGDLSIYYSTTRSMARFGILAINKGNWAGQNVVPSSFFENATHSSQAINQAYGYLWWINGQNTYRLPQTQNLFTGNLIPAAPSDLFCALGKNDQKIYCVPSKNMVVIRMGDQEESSNFALSGFDNNLWLKLRAVYE